MSQMTNFRKVLGACLAVFVLMGAQSCNRDVAEPSSVDGKTQAEEIIYKEGTEEMPISETLSFDFSEEENQLKALDATVSATTGATNRHGVAYANKIPVVCIVRSDQGDPVTYVDNVEIIKQANGTYKFAKDRVRLRAGSTLAPGKKWYLMVVTQNSFNKNNGELSVNATGAPETLSSSATRVMDIPSASPWIELPMFPNGQPKWSKDWDANRKAKRLKLYPQGVLCRATLRLDDAYKTKLGSDNVDLKITQLKVVSTALSFSGKFKFDENSLPPITQTEERPTIAWEPTQTASTAREYRALDANTPEYQKVFNAPNGGSVLQVNGSGSTTTIFADSNSPSRVDKMSLPQGVQSILFWAVPVKGATNRHTTLIAETGESTLPNKVLAPSHTYIYGKKHTKDAGQGRAIYFDAVYYNPYTPLDYMAEYNLARNNPGEFRAGGLIPTQPSNKLATDHGVNSFAMVTQSQVVTIKIPGADGRTYVNPDIDQWESVIPYQGDAAVNLSGGGPVNNATVNVALGTKKGVTKFSSRRIGNVVYALALADFGGTQKYRVAYRYAAVDNPDVPETMQPAFEFQRTLDFAKVRSRQCPCHKDNPRFVIAGYAYPVRRSFQVEAIHLGAGFVGGVEDIAKEEFWSQGTVNKEKRVLPLHTNAWRAYGNPTGIPNGIATNYKLRDKFFKDNNINRYQYDHAVDCYPGSWGASILSEVNGPTFYYLGDPRVAICKGDTGWALYDLRGTGKNEKLLQVARYSCRPFTKQSR